ncbi:MAG TPA: FAD-dependent oxidoreductase [Ramlibacter sp.]|nr:FAD-dependent oxidoreductase [Ramlibacter sp.]
MLLDAVDVAVLGAGPAGLAAAATAAEQGLSVALLDEQANPGGQIYREVTRAGLDRLQVLGNDYAAGRALVERFAHSTARHVGGAAVWNVTRERVIGYLKDGRSQSITAGQVILCTGAMERPFSIPGWTLPGVMTAGAAQILLKSAGLAPSQPVVLAGCGPLLYLLAWQYLRAGVRIGALVDTTQRGDYLRALRHIGGALAGWREVRKGLGLVRSIQRAGIPFYRAATELAVEGGSRATALRFRCGATSHRVETELVLLHQGVVPNNQITASLRVAHHWDDHQLCWVPEADAWGRLGLAGFLIAGDGRGIAGAAAAALQGQLAGLAAAHDAGRLSEVERDRQAKPVRSALRRQLHIRPFLDTLYRAKIQHRVPADDVIACRCEEVSAGELRRLVALGCTGPNQTKAFARCGMGPCQGRLCGLTVSEVIAHERGVSPAEVGHYRIRPPIKPITLEELAAL